MTWAPVAIDGCGLFGERWTVLMSAYGHEARF